MRYIPAQYLGKKLNAYLADTGGEAVECTVGASVAVTADNYSTGSCQPHFREDLVTHPAADVAKVFDPLVFDEFPHLLVPCCVLA